MSPSASNTSTFLWLGGSLAALLIAVGSLVHAIAGWGGPYRKRRLLRFGIGIGALPVLFAAYLAILWGIVIPADRRRIEHQSVDAVSLVHVGDSAPSFSLKDTRTREFSLDELRGKVVLLNFFATWCGPCVQEMPHLQEIWDEYGERDDFAMLIIGRKEADELIAVFQSKYGYTVPMASDADQSVYSLYAKKLIPRTYVIAQDGKICFACGDLNEENLNDLRKELALQLASGQ